MKAPLPLSALVEALLEESGRSLLYHNTDIRSLKNLPEDRQHKFVAMRDRLASYPPPTFLSEEFMKNPLWKVVEFV
jgi:hypothetical protein